MVPFAAPALKRHEAIPNTTCAVVGVDHPVRLQVEESDDSDSTFSAFHVSASLPIQNDAGYSAVEIQKAAAKYVLKSADYVVFRIYRSQGGYCGRLTQINCGGRIR